MVLVVAIVGTQMHALRANVCTTGWMGTNLHCSPSHQHASTPPTTPHHTRLHFSALQCVSIITNYDVESTSIFLVSWCVCVATDTLVAPPQGGRLVGGKIRSMTRPSELRTVTPISGEDTILGVGKRSLSALISLFVSSLPRCHVCVEHDSAWLGLASPAVGCGSSRRRRRRREWCAPRSTSLRLRW